MENRWADLSSYLGSRQGGMQQLEQHLLELYQSGVISGTEAMKLATNPETVAEGLRDAQSIGGIVSPRSAPPSLRAGNRACDRLPPVLDPLDRPEP